MTVLRRSQLYAFFLMVDQVGLKPTIALSTGFTVRGDTNYTVLNHMVEPTGLEPATTRLKDGYSKTD